MEPHNSATAATEDISMSAADGKNGRMLTKEDSKQVCTCKVHGQVTGHPGKEEG